MQSVNTQRFDVKQYSIPLIKKLILIAGSTRRFAALCGVSLSVVNNHWLREGISRRGAVLISWSKEFEALLKPTDLRPDLDARALTNITSDKRFLICRSRQIQFETGPDFEVESPLAALRDISGIND